MFQKKPGNNWERAKVIRKYNNRSFEIQTSDGALQNRVFKGQKVVILTAMRSEMVKIIHDSSHQGCNQASRRARDVMFWPGMTKAIMNYVLACPLCERYRHANVKEPLLPHAVPARPWQHLSCDIFAFENSHYLITVDAYSRHFEIDYLPDMKSTTVIRKLKVHFSRFGIPLPSLKIGDRVMFQKKPGDNWERAKVIRKYNNRSFEIQTSDGALYWRNGMFINKSNSDHNLNPSVQQNHKEDKRFQVQPVKDSVSTNAKQNYITRSGREVKPLRSLSKNEWVMQISHD